MTDVSLIYPSQKRAGSFSVSMMSITSAILSVELSDISEEDADCMIRTIEKFYQIMCERRSHYDK